MEYVFENNGLFDAIFDGKFWNETFGMGTLNSQPQVIEDETARHYIFDVPGATKENLKIDLVGNVLSLRYVTTDRFKRSRACVYVIPGDVDLDDDPIITLENGLAAITVGLRVLSIPSPAKKRQLRIT